MAFNDLKLKYSDLPTKTKIAIQVGLAFLVAIIAMMSQSSTNQPPQEKAPSLDTFIPDGFVLVPIEVENFESLDQILGQYGTVDLYPSLPNSSGAPNAPIAHSIRLLRSPVKSNHFAVLAPEAKAPWLVQYGGPFRVVIKNKDQASGTKIDSPRAKSKRRQVVVEVSE